jgi:FixJ family two-component response regulator
MPHDSSLAADGAPARLLISLVDDDDAARSSLGQLLRTMGYTVQPFDSAASFLCSRYLHETACLILDVHLGAITGPELYAWITAMGIQTPVIFITGDVESAHQLAVEHPGVSVLLKPFPHDVLFRAIRTALKLDTN